MTIVTTLIAPGRRYVRRVVCAPGRATVALSQQPRPAHSVRPSVRAAR